MILEGFYNLDCMEVLPEIPDNYFDLAVCDPPYGINYDKKAAAASGKKYGNAKAFKTEYKAKGWDTETPGAEYFKELRRVSKSQVIWGGELFYKLFTAE